MKKKLIQYYPPDDDFFKKLWEDALIVPDANILLNLYRYDEKTRTEFLEILDKLKEKLWVPHQVALEYQKNRINEIINQREKFNAVKKIFIDSKKELSKDINEYVKKYPHFDTSAILEPVKSAYDGSIAEIDRMIEQDPDFLQKDPIRESLTQIFENKVGHRYSLLRELELLSDAERRFELEIPPGYEDYRTKPGIRKFGDFILWFQMLDHAKGTKKSIIFITDDKKEDWWWIHNRRTIGPRPELIEEINERAKVSFHMYNSRGFIEWASGYIEQHISPETLKEVENIQKERQRQLDSLENYYFEKTLIELYFLGNKGRNGIVEPALSNIKGLSKKDILNAIYEGEQRGMIMDISTNDGIQWLLTPKGVSYAEALIQENKQ